MTNTPNGSSSPDSAPITITLQAGSAAALMAVTRNYAAVLSFEKRLDYAIAELALWQQVHRQIFTQQDDSVLVATAYETHQTIVELIERSIREGLSE